MFWLFRLKPASGVADSDMDAVDPTVNLPVERITAEMAVEAYRHFDGVVRYQPHDESVEYGGVLFANPVRTYAQYAGLKADGEDWDFLDDLIWGGPDGALYYEGYLAGLQAPGYKFTPQDRSSIGLSEDIIAGIMDAQAFLEVHHGK